MLQMNLMEEPQGRNSKSKSLVVRFLDVFGSVWMGIIWATLLFIYCSIGSGVPSFRQLPYFELTEFEWFHWWPFNVLIALFCFTLTIVTVRKIPLRLVNAGVWTIHTGIIVLCIGSYIYFGTKIEGDAPVFRRKVTIQHPGLNEPVSMLAVPGNVKTVAVGPDQWRFQIQDTNTDWPLLTDEDKGKKAYAVNVMVQPPKVEPFVRQLLAGYPQYTEDVIPGKGRAVKSLGRKLIDESLEMTLDFEPTEYFQVMDTWALFVRPVGEKEWSEWPIDGLPRYNDFISSRDQVYSDPHHPLRIRPIDLTVSPPAEGSELSGAAMHITGFLRYAEMQRRWSAGGGRLNPVLQLSLQSNQAAPRDYELIALDSRRATTPDGNVQFVWLNDRAQVDALPTDSRALLKITVPEAELALEVPVAPDSVGGDFVPLEGTEFAYRIQAVHDQLALPGRDRPVSIVAVEVKTPERTFRRWVADNPQLTKDLPGETADPHAMQTSEPDPRFVMTYHPQSAPLIFAAHPGGLHFVFNGPDGRLMSRDVVEGDRLEILPGLSMRIDGFAVDAVSNTKPYIVPLSRRQERVGSMLSMIRLEMQSGDRIEAKWIPFHQYVFPDEQYAYSGKFAYSPTEFDVGNGRRVQVIFSRKRLALPNPIAMEDFQLDTHLGGYSGSASTIRNYVSRLRFLDNGQWTEPTPIAVNNPTEYGGFWYFQSTWDRPGRNDGPGGGMNFTGLGIGNRNGVYIQLAGCCIAVAGMIFAFYVKPILKRRRAEQSRAKVSRSASALSNESVEEMEAATVEA